jgi:hypothetical protein
MNRVTATLALLLSLWVPCVGRAEVSVKNGWDKSGRVTVTSPGRRAVFARETGALVIYSRPGLDGKETARIVPFTRVSTGKKEARKIASCRVVEQDGNGAKLEVAFAAGDKLMKASFTFSASGDLRVAPAGEMQGISILAEIGYGVLPGIVPDDVIYDPAKSSPAGVAVPAENIFVCLLGGEHDILACAWPRGDQKLRLVRAGDRNRPRFRAVELDLDGRPAYLGIISAPGIWHRQKLSPSFMEKDVVIGWRRPFPATWKTQLSESGVMTSYGFTDHEEEIWRPDTGSYTYPVRFEGEKAVFHLGKKIPPEGNAFIYAMEGHEDTPLQFMKRCSEETAGILAGIKERKEYAPPTRLKTNVGYWHCWGTAMVKRTIYKYGMQARERKFLKEHLDNYLDLAASNQGRHQEYVEFAAAMKGRLDSWEKDDAGNKAYLARMQGLLEKMREKFMEPMEGVSPAGLMKEAEDLGDRLRVLLPEEGTESYPEYCHIVARLNDISAGMQEEVGKWFGTGVREWFQEAAYGCADNPGAVKYAQEIRRAIRDMLKVRNWEVIDTP